MESIKDLKNLIGHNFNAGNFSKYMINNDFADVDQLIKDCQLENSGQRFNIWRLFLRIYSKEDSFSQKIEKLTKLRENYKELENKHLKNSNPQSQNKLEDSTKKGPLGGPFGGPLGGGKQKQQQSNAIDNVELRNEIKKDVERTYQEFEFFSSKRIQQILTTVLFLWCKENSEISYRQGMNEIAASLIYIYTIEALYKEEVEKYEEATEEEINILLLFNSWEYAEPDIYALFTALMNDAQHMEMFRPNYTEQQKIKLQSKKPSAILTRVAKLQDILLKQVDLQLFRHLKLLQVEFQIFLLKWIRCMFTRELSLIESFHAWDAIFQDFFIQQCDTLFFVDCIAMAMIIYLKNQLMENEESSQCYQRFLKFPKISNLSSLLDTATQIRNILISQKSSNNLDDNVEGAEKIEKLISPAFFVSDKVDTDSKTQQDKIKSHEQPQQSQIKQQPVSQQVVTQNEEEQSQSPQSQIIEKQPIKQQEQQSVFFDDKIMQTNTKAQKSQFSVEENVQQKESVQESEDKQKPIKLSIKAVQDICTTIEEAFNVIKKSNESQNHQELIISLAELKQYLTKQINEVEGKQGNSQDDGQKNKNGGFVIKKQLTGQQQFPQEDNGIKSKMAGFFKKW